MLYQFKTKIEDFIVQEQIPFTPSGKGDFLYVFFEKRWINTMDVVSFICKELNLDRYELGFAWLKDKHWITQQRISIGKKTMEKFWGEKVFISELSKHAKIIETTRHESLLKVWMNSWNTFEIILRRRQQIDSKIKHQINKSLNTIKHNWFPNYFGMQRFGQGMRNLKRAKKFLYENGDPDKKHIKFNLQAFSSYHFNQLLTKRLQQGKIFLEGDLVMDGYNARTNIWYIDGNMIQLFDYKKCKEKYEGRDFFYPDFLTKKIPYNEKRIPSAPIIGRNILLPPHQSPAFILEWEFLKALKFFELDAFDKFQLYGLRRPMFVVATNLEYSFDDQNNLTVKFFLPTWSYATILLGMIFQDIDIKTCEQNGLKIPQ